MDMKESKATGIWSQPEHSQQRRLGMRGGRDREKEIDERPRGQKEPREEPRLHVAKVAELYRQGREAQGLERFRVGVRG